MSRISPLAIPVRLLSFAVLVCALGAIAGTGLTFPAGAGGQPRHDAVERSIVELINRERAVNGRAPLRISPSLGRAADAHSRDMATRAFFSHNSPAGGAWTQRVKRFVRIFPIGETIAWVRGGGSGIAGTVVTNWMNSPPHRSVLLNPAFRRIGVARRSNRGRVHYFTADLAR